MYAMLSCFFLFFKKMKFKVDVPIGNTMRLRVKLKLRPNQLRPTVPNPALVARGVGDSTLVDQVRIWRAFFIKPNKRNLEKKNLFDKTINPIKWNNLVDSKEKWPKRKWNNLDKWYKRGIPHIKWCTTLIVYTDKTNMLQATVHGRSLDDSLLTQSFRIKHINVYIYPPQLLRIMAASLSWIKVQ